MKAVPRASLPIVCEEWMAGWVQGGIRHVRGVGRFMWAVSSGGTDAAVLRNRRYRANRFAKETLVGAFPHFRTLLWWRCGLPPSLSMLLSLLTAELRVVSDHLRTGFTASSAFTARLFIWLPRLGTQASSLHPLPPLYPPPYIGPQLIATRSRRNPPH